MRLIVSDWKKIRRHINQVKYKGGRGDCRGSHEVQGGRKKEARQEEAVGDRGREREGNWERVAEQMEGWLHTLLRVKTGRESRPGRCREPGDSLHPSATKKS